MVSNTPNASNPVYDVVIIGGGPAGLNAALYTQRKGLSTIVAAGQFGGQVANTSTVENYLGIKSEGGYDLSMIFADHVKELGVPLMEYVTADSYRKTEDGLHQVKLSDGSTLTGRTMLIATGSTPKHLDVPGEEDYNGLGVSYCAICDGPLYRGKKVVVSGGGNSAVQAAMDLGRICGEVYLVQRSSLRADQILQEQVEKLDNVKIHLQTQIREILGDGQKVSGVEVLDKLNGETRMIDADGVFVQIGSLPNAGPFAGVVETNDFGEIVVDQFNQTSEQGLFAAGDVTDVMYKQIIVAASEGAAAALSITSFLNQGLV